MSDPALVHVLAALGVAVVERKPDGSLDLVGEMPPWFARLFPEQSGSSLPDIQQHIPFLESFLPDAEVFWEEGGKDRLRSGLCTEVGESGAEYHFEVSALCVSGRHFLLFELRKDFGEIREILQRARENLLDYELLEHTQRALERSQAELSKAKDAAEELREALERHTSRIPAPAEPVSQVEEQELEGFDPGIVAALRGMQKPGQPDMFNELLGIFRTMLPAQLAQMRQAVAEGQPAVLEQVAHKLRGSSANMGATKIASLCTELEAIGEQGKLEGASQLLGQLESLIHRISV
jgi:HPt (histidine-containing phosphotransfer) domain-containing protein